jgi:hypothetical protein
MPRKAVIIPFPTPPAPPPGGVPDPGLVEVHRCSHAEALVVRSLLESHGIPVLVRSRIAQSVHPFTVGTQGEIVLLVPEADARRARRVLGRVATSNLRRAK